MLTRRRRSGVSLIELIVVLAIVGVAAGAVTRIGTHQQRQYGNMAARALAIGQLREGTSVLAAELAGLAPAAGDIHDGGLGRAAIAFRAPRATLVLCGAAEPATGHLTVADVRAAVDPAGRDQNVFDADDALAAGDSILLYDATADSSGAPLGEAWRAHVVATATHVRQPCLTGDSVHVPAIRATIAPPIDRPLDAHAPARAFRAVRYALYRGADNRWYLGFSDCRPLVRTPACTPMQPVAGPYLPTTGASSPLGGGLQFEYLDADGTVTEDRFAVAAVRLTLRANAALPGAPDDTVAVTRTIGFRNSR